MLYGHQVYWNYCQKNMIYVINTRKNLFILELKLHFEVEKICIIVPAVDCFQ